jgi:hypothetical protein
MHIIGDVRYANKKLNRPYAAYETLPDQSVALHAYSIKLQKSIIDKTKKLKPSENSKKMDPPRDDNNDTKNHVHDDHHSDDDKTTANDDDDDDDDDDVHVDHNMDEYHYWKAPIPETWESYFDCTQSMIDAWEEQYPIAVVSE